MWTPILFIGIVPIHYLLVLFIDRHCYCSSSPDLHQRQSRNCHCINTGHTKIHATTDLPSIHQLAPPDRHRKKHQWISGFGNTKPPATATHNTHYRCFTDQQHRPPDAASQPSQPSPTGGSPQQRQHNRSSSATVHNAIAFSSHNRLPTPAAVNPRRWQRLNQCPLRAINRSSSATAPSVVALNR